MTNRREFLRGAAILSTAPLAQRSFAKARSGAPLDIVVVDSRYREARTFGEFAAKQGAVLRHFEADITNLWKQDLLGLWKASAGPVAGLSERPALFLLERLAWDHGQRVVFEAEHELGTDGRVRHRVLRSGNPDLAAQLEAAGADWPDLLADALLQQHTPAPFFHPTEAAMAAHLGESPKLHSWIIAPRRSSRG